MANPLAIKAGIEILIAVISKIKSKPKTGIKEASAGGIFASALAIYQQYSLGGVDTIETTSVTALVTAIWVLGMRLYQKHSDD